LEAHLEYANPGDLVWREASRLDIPIDKHPNAIEMEETIKQGAFWDYDDQHIDELESLARLASGLPARSGLSGRSVAGHLSSIAFLVTDKKEMSKAKRFILGQWTDGVVTLNIGPNHELGWLCTDQKHPLNVGEQVHNHSPDWWNFAMWQIYLMNDEHKCGTHTGVLNVDESELHLNGTYPHRIAHVFCRCELPQANHSTHDAKKMNTGTGMASQAFPSQWFHGERSLCEGGMIFAVCCSR
jgi:hypothetical protein